MSHQAYVKAFNTGPQDAFGEFLALSRDGATLAVGARGEDSAATGIDGNQADESATDAGAVYLYKRTLTSWVPDKYLKASNANANDRFGSVALSEDGSVVLVGADGEASAANGVGGAQTDNSRVDAGAAYAFE